MKAGIWVTGIMAFLLAASSGIAAQKNIFDDDWAPPKPSETSKPAEPPKTVPIKPADPVKPVKPTAANPTVTPEKTVPSVHVASAGRRAIPGKSEQGASRKVLREVFADQLIDRTPAARKKLAEALLVMAEKSADSPTDQFVLWAAAMDAGVDAMQLPLAFKAADQMAKGFEVDGLALKADIAGKLAPRPGAVDLSEENARAALAVVDQLSDAEEFSAAGRVCAAIAPMMGRNPGLRIDLQKRQREVTEKREAAQKFAQYSEKLKLSPDDAEANLEVGRYLCFYKCDWKGLAALARGSNPALKTLAQKELAGANTTEAQVALADEWWEMSEGMGPATKGSVEWHAAEWYAKAAPKLKGLSRAKAEKRIDSVRYAGPRGGGATAVAVTKPETVKVEQPIPPVSASPATEAPKTVKKETKAVPVASGERLTPQQTTRRFITNEQRLAAKSPDSAEVEIDAKWDKLDDGVAMVSDERENTTGEVPSSLRGRPFTRLRAGQGKTTFKVVKDGIVLMACTDRWGKGGNSSGNWKPELTTRAELEKQGWSEVAIIPLTEKKMVWIVFKRACKAGEVFTYRTEKYNPPLLIE